MTNELQTIVDLIRYAASRFNAAGLTFGHSHDNAIDEATHLVLSCLHLPPDLPPAYGSARVTAIEKNRVLSLIDRRIETREPVAYLVGEAWFAGMPFKSDARALVPRSPIAELIEDASPAATRRRSDTRRARIRCMSAASAKTFRIRTGWTCGSCPTTSARAQR
jgi:methylase of polypeptide subunit release factors